MEWAELVLRYLDVLAWPAVAAGTLTVFRGQLRDLLGRMTSAEGAGVKAEFAAEIAEHSRQLKLDRSQERAGERPSDGTPDTPKTPETPETPETPGTPGISVTKSREPHIKVRVNDVSDTGAVRALLDTHDVVELDMDDATNFARMAMMGWAVGLAEGRGDLTLDDLESSSNSFKIRHLKGT